MGSALRPGIVAGIVARGGANETGPVRRVRTGPGFDPIGSRRQKVKMASKAKAPWSTGTPAVLTVGSSSTSGLHW